MPMILILRFDIGSRFLCKEGFEKFYLLHLMVNKYNLERNKFYLKKMG